VHLAKIRHYNRAMFGWSKSISYFLVDSCNGQFVIEVVKNAVATTVLVTAGKSFRPKSAFEVAVNVR
jgi:hypothetical protein